MTRDEVRRLDVLREGARPAGKMPASCCPVCDLDWFDGDFEVVPAAVPCVQHVHHPVAILFLTPENYEHIKTLATGAGCVRCGIELGGALPAGPGPLCGWCECDLRNAVARAAVARP